MSNLYIVLRGYFPGYAATVHCINWISNFDRLGVQATVVNLRPNDEFSIMPNLYQNISIINLWEKQIKIRNRHLRFVQYLYNVWNFSKQIKQKDIVWIYDCPEILPFFINRKCNVFAEVTEHPSTWKNNPILSIFHNKILLSYKKLDGLFVISKGLKSAFLSYGVSESRIHIINMTVDPQRFKNLKSHIIDPNITYCGNGTNNKDGVDLLIKAFYTVHQSYPSYKLRIIGKIPKMGDSSGNLELIKSLGIENSVVFLGKKNMEEIPQILMDASILALCRPDSIQARNGFPSKLGEYLLTGNIVVVTNVGDIPNFLSDKENALVAEHDNINDFASKLIWAIEHPKEASKIGKKGIETALKCFNSIIEAKKMLKTMNIIK